MARLLDGLTPSRRAHGAQRSFAATILVLEAFVVFFAVLAAHQLAPDLRALTWPWGLGSALLLVLCAGLLRRGAWPYVLGGVLQVPVVLLGVLVTPMWIIGGAFAVFYVYAVLTGHRFDREKDAVDRRVLAGDGAEDDGTPAADGTPAPR